MLLRGAQREGTCSIFRVRRVGQAQHDIVACFHKSEGTRLCKKKVNAQPAHLLLNISMKTRPDMAAGCRGQLCLILARNETTRKRPPPPAPRPARPPRNNQRTQELCQPLAHSATRPQPVALVLRTAMAMAATFITCRSQTDKSRPGGKILRPGHPRTPRPAQPAPMLHQLANTASFQPRVAVRTRATRCSAGAVVLPKRCYRCCRNRRLQLRNAKPVFIFSLVIAPAVLW